MAAAAVAVGALLWLGAAWIPGVGGEPEYAHQLRTLALFLPAAALAFTTESPYPLRIHSHSDGGGAVPGR